MQHDAASVLTTWVNEFNAGNVDAIASLYSPDATLFGTISPALTKRPEDVRAYFAAVAKSRMQVKLVDAPTVTSIVDAAVVLSGLYEFPARGRMARASRCPLATVSLSRTSTTSGGSCISILHHGQRQSEVT